MDDGRFNELTRILRFATQEAKRLHQEYVGTEHLLLALIKEPKDVAGKLLCALGISVNRIRSEVGKLVQGAPDVVPIGGTLPRTPRAKRVFEYAIEEAETLKPVGTQHILLGLLRDDNVASCVLQNLGLTEDKVRCLVKLSEDREVIPP
jgi:ATP-dependent Clp protease ATP-binding subunit ClpC